MTIQSHRVGQMKNDFEARKKIGKILLVTFFLKKWANTGLFFIYFRLFKQTLQFLQQTNVKKCPSSIWCRDSNSQPSDY